MGNKKKNKPAETIKENKNRLIVYILLLVLVPSCLYFRVVNFNLSNFDDSVLITDNYNIISNIENIPKAFTVDAFFSHRTSFYRPLQTVSFIIDSQISGKNTWAYHLTNFILHLLIVLVLFTLLNKLEIRRDIALLLSLLYSVHPLLTSAVCWIPARGDLFLTLFGLMSFISFIEYFSKKQTKNLIYHFICFFLACFAKETAIVFPFLLTFYFYFNYKREKSWKEMLPFLFIWSGSFLIYFYLRNSAISGANPSAVSGISAFIKNLPAIPITFGKILLPIGLTTMPLFNNRSVIIGILIFTIFIVLIVKYKVYNNTYLILGALWFLGFTLPPLYYRMRIAEFSVEYFEHRTLLPVIGILIIIGVFLKEWSLRKTLKIFIPVLILYSIIAFTHSRDYYNPITFFSSAIASNSDNVGALNARGVEYMQEGNIQESLADLDRAIKIYPYYSSPYFNKGFIYHSAGDNLKAEYFFSQALKYDTLLPGVTYLRSNILYNLAGEKMALKKYDEAILLLKKALKESPMNSDMYNNLGYSYFSKESNDSALYAFSKAIEFKPNQASLYTNRGLTKYSMKDYKGALSDYNKALELNPDAAGSWYNTGNTKIVLNDYEGAIIDLSNAIKMNPNWGEAYFQRGVAYSKLNEQLKANEDWEKAQKLGPKGTVDAK